MTKAQKYARLSPEGVVLEVFVPVDDVTGKRVEPADVFPETLAAQFVACPKATQPNDQVQEGKLVPAPPPSPAPLPLLAPLAFYLAFTPAERIAIKASEDATVREFWETFEMLRAAGLPIDPNLTSVRQGLAYLLSQKILANAERVDAILRGDPQ